MAGRYRALLIGNATYPADEHNLQPLRGPVQDIAALNRALADPDVGLFADVDVTLLPEASSGPAIRALGRFFGSAARDDVLLVYFSGHGKLDLSGRLHLCMQDTDTTDLLATAVSSTRITEFAEASRARTTVVVLDCCYSGAFRGGDLGESVAGPGRYVLTSCRGTQLADDATWDSATSVFTQHLVDGLLGAAPDHHGNGFVDFGDLYTYVDRRLRESGKQIPQQRVDGDGRLPLARRRAPVTSTPVSHAPPPSAPVSPAPVSPDSAAGTPDSAAGTSGAAGPPSTPAPSTPAPNRARLGTRGRVLVALVAVIVLAGVAIAAVSLLSRGGGDTFVADGPWRLRIVDSFPSTDPGCAVTVTDTATGTRLPLAPLYYGRWSFQVHQAGTFRWTVSDPHCAVTAVAGSGSATLPFDLPAGADSDAFAAPARVAVHVVVRNAASCSIRLVDPTTGGEVDTAAAAIGQDDVSLDPRGRSSVYVGYSDCAVGVAAAS